MIDFMVIALPRSGTTWAANWLTTETTHCIHDPLYSTHYADLDAIEKPGKAMGVSCTGLYHFADWLNAHPARKVILHRPLVDIQKSMVEIGLPPVGPEAVSMLNRIKGEHYEFSDLFDSSMAAGMWRFLTGKPMDYHRHAELVQIEMQPKFSGLKVGPEVTRRLVAELVGIMQGQK